MSLRINDTIPDMTVETDHGTIQLHDWIGDSWAILFSHPKDFTPVCTTEFGAVAQLADEWACLLMALRTTKSGKATSKKLLGPLPVSQSSQTLA